MVLTTWPDRAPDFPLFRYGDQHHTRIPKGCFGPNGDGAVYVSAVLLMYTWYLSRAVVSNLPIVVLRVSIYSAGSSGSRSGSPTTVVNGMGGSLP